MRTDSPLVWHFVLAPSPYLISEHVFVRVHLLRTTLIAACVDTGARCSGAAPEYLTTASSPAVIRALRVILLQLAIHWVSSVLQRG